MCSPLTALSAQRSKYLRIRRRLYRLRDSGITQHDFVQNRAPKREHHLARSVDGAAYAKVRGIAELGARDLPVVARQSVRAPPSPNIPN